MTTKERSEIFGNHILQMMKNDNSTFCEDPGLPFLLNDPQFMATVKLAQDVETKEEIIQLAMKYYEHLKTIKLIKDNVETNPELGEIKKTLNGNGITKLVYDCPMCSTSDSIVVVPENGIGHCFACGYGMEFPKSKFKNRPAPILN